jgi:methyltransferase (TIGR00027 family)
MQILGLLVYVVVQILFIPVALAGTVYMAVKQLCVSKRLGVSATATSVAGNRWVLDKFGLRADPAAVRLYAALPNASVLGMWSFVLPSWLRHKISGDTGSLIRLPEPGHESIAQVGFARFGHFDALIDKRRASVEQFVLLGAGYDTRAYGSLKDAGLRFFELDLPNNLAFKREALAKAGIDASHVTFVSVNFATDEWTHALLAAGYAADHPAIFLWEGVTIYLPEQAVRGTLQQFAAIAAPGSALLVDLYNQRDVRSLGRVMTSHTQEAMHFGLEFGADPVASARSFVASENLRLGEAHVMGDKTRRGAFGIVAELHPK